MGGGFVMQIGFETAQLILDIMTMDDEFIKLPINKRKFKQILKEYRQTQGKWNEVKKVVDEWNNKVDNMQDIESEFEKIEWKSVDVISREVEECILNIDN